jgi:hypothetical protein
LRQSKLGCEPAPAATGPQKVITPVAHHSSAVLL